MKIAVIGAGTMGCSLAFVLAKKGYDANLVDINDTRLKEAEKNILEKDKFSTLLSLGGKERDLANRIRYSTNLESVKDSDLIIENITEDNRLKVNLYKKLNKIVNTQIVISNSSCISIDLISMCMDKPENIIGIHFMNPVEFIDSVEVIKGTYTSKDTIEYIKGFLDKIGKKYVIINNSVGYISNRVSHVFMNEAASLVYEKIATPEQIDFIFKSCFGHKMGPCETADLIGIDTVVSSLNILYEYYGDIKYSASPILKKMVETNQLGRKNGKGFYQY